MSLLIDRAESNEESSSLVANPRYVGHSLAVLSSSFRVQHLAQYLLFNYYKSSYQSVSLSDCYALSLSLDAIASVELHMTQRE